MPDFGIAEAFAAISALTEAGAGAGLAAGGGELAAAGADIGLDSALAAGGAGLGLEAGIAGGTDLLGGAGAAGSAVGGAGDALAATGGVAETAAAAPAGGLSALSPAGTAGGLAPAGASPIDLASAAAANPTGDATALFNGAAPGGSGFPSTAGNGIWSDTSEAISQGLNPEGGLVSGSLNPETGLSASNGLAQGGTSELSSLASGTAAPGGGASNALASAGTTLAPGTGAAPGGSGTFLDSLLGGATKAATTNPLGTAVAAGGLGYSILEGQKVSSNEQALQAAAGTQAGNGAALQNYINTGQLPPGMAAQVANATAAAKASIISGYASRGQNANPSQNSALAQELAQVDMNALAMQGQLATQLLTAGLNETNMSDTLYAQLIGIDQTQAKNTGTAISNFASALAGGPKTIQIGNTATA